MFKNQQLGTEAEQKRARSVLGSSSSSDSKKYFPFAALPPFIMLPHQVDVLSVSRYLTLVHKLYDCCIFEQCRGNSHFFQECLNFPKLCKGCFKTDVVCPTKRCNLPKVTDTCFNCYTNHAGSIHQCKANNCKNFILPLTAIACHFSNKDFITEWSKMWSSGSKTKRFEVLFELLEAANSAHFLKHNVRLFVEF